MLINHVTPFHTHSDTMLYLGCERGSQLTCDSDQCYQDKLPVLLSSLCYVFK